MQRPFNDYAVENNVVYLHATNRRGERIATFLFDLADLPALKARGRWCARFLGKKRYPRLTATSGRKEDVHRYLLDAPRGKVVDHIDRDPLNNRRANLRLCTISENLQNRDLINPTSSSGHRNVRWYARGKCWIVGVTSKGKGIHIGYFRDLEAAVAAAKAARKRYMPYSME